jgi:cytochrome c553
LPGEGDRGGAMSDGIVWHRWRWLCPVAFAAAAMNGTAWAAPDLELGRYLAAECMTCHRGTAPADAIPNIFGMAAPRFTTLVKAYRDGKLPNPVMQNVAGRLKDEDIEALAAYFAQAQRP